MNTFTDTTTGRLVRLVTRGKYFKHPDEIDASPYQKTVTNGASLQRTETGAEWTNTRNPNVTTMDSQTAPEPFGPQRTPSRRSATPSAQQPAAEHRRSTSSTHSAGTGSSSSDTVTDIDITKLETQKSVGDRRVVTFLPEDPINPQNWPFLKKCWVTCQLCLLTLSIYIGSAIYTSGVEDITAHFHVSQVVATLGLTLFVLGYGLGPMFLGGFAEAPMIGRTPVYIVSVIAFTLLNLGVYYASNIGMLLAFRFLTGFIGSPILATGGASLADIWSPIKRMYAIGVWGLFAVLGPVLGPVIGNWAAMFKGWRWPILELIWLNAFVAIVLILFLPETSAANILYRRTRRLRKAFEDPTLVCEAEIEVEQISKNDIMKMVFVLPFRLGFTEPILLATNLYLGLVYAILYCWFEAFPLAFIGVYKMSLGISGLPFLSLVVGAWVASAGYFTYLYFVTEKDMKNGTMTPEKRLPVACVGAFGLPICMFWFGFTAKEDIHWISPTIAAAFFSIGACLLFNAILNYQADAYPK